jgi:hypothetical protein
MDIQPVNPGHMLFSENNNLPSTGCSGRSPLWFAPVTPTAVDLSRSKTSYSSLTLSPLVSVHLQTRNALSWGINATLDLNGDGIIDWRDRGFHLQAVYFGARSAEVRPGAMPLATEPGNVVSGRRGGSGPTS